MPGKVKLKDYERHVLGRLCWVCHVPTTGSSAQQRQCPRCRWKWSYRQRQLRWNLLQLFACALAPAEASRRLRISYRTAWTHFFSFELVLRRMPGKGGSFLHYRDDIQKGRMPWKEISPDQEVIGAIYHAEFHKPR